MTGRETDRQIDFFLRPLVEGDIATISAYASGPGAQPWWTDPSESGVRAALLDAPDTFSFAVVVEGEVAGAVSAFDTGWPLGSTMGLVIVLGEAWQGKGLGPRALSVLVSRMIAMRGIRRFTVDPATTNERAIRAYASLGFRPIGVARESEPAPDGAWRDCLLMDMLATEFADGSRA